MAVDTSIFAQRVRIPLTKCHSSEESSHAGQYYTCLLYSYIIVLNFVVFQSLPVSAFPVSAFALDFAAYSAEILRSGIEAVPAGQARTAKALGFGPVHAFRKAIWPHTILQGERKRKPSPVAKPGPLSSAVS